MRWFKKLVSKLTDLEHVPSFVLTFIRGYNNDKYWKRRAIVIDDNNKTNILRKLYYLVWIKNVDGRKQCSFGTNLNYGASFSTPPICLMGQRVL